VSERPVLVWFRRDLRLADNPALDWAARSGRPVVPVFVLDDEDHDDWLPGAASRWWLHGSLQALHVDLRDIGSGLTLRQGQAKKVITDLAVTLDVAAVVWNRMYDPGTVERDASIKNALLERGLEAKSFQAALLFEPWDIRTKTGVPYRVFTPFWRLCRQLSVPPCSARPEHLRSVDDPLPFSESLHSWLLLPSGPDWAGGLQEQWVPGERAALRRLEAFLSGALRVYANDRDRPDRDGTSMLSPHLHFGEISPRQIWHAIQAREPGDGEETFLKEVGWREFCHQLLFNNPTLPDANLQVAFDAMPWRNDAAALERWQHGKTGYPIVDAGMRQLWQTGWMHNRVRMIVASFLTKHLLIDWRCGERWFWDTLVDADLANNSAGWQWVAGSGADASPFFRIFNPMAQSRKFDPSGAYLRRWLPELKDLSDDAIHEPWTATREDLERAGVNLGSNYPEPMVDHKSARERALEAYKTHVSIKSD
jgi:deoxyribodipyrimidine photo-lyase